MAVNESALPYRHPLYDVIIDTPGLSVALGPVDQLLTWGLKNSLWVFPMATSCCGIEFMAASASRVDLDRMGTIPRASPRQADVMLVAGTITVKMAPRVRRLWDQMPEPKWCVAMGSCAISGDFYRNLYPVVPGIDTFLPVDVYIPGCPPNPEAVMHGLLRLQERVNVVRAGQSHTPETRPAPFGQQKPCIPSMEDPARPAGLTEDQTSAALRIEREVEAGGGLSLPVLPAPAIDRGHGPNGDFTLWMRERFGAEESAGASPLVPADRHVALTATLQSLGYTQLVYVAASHWPGSEGKPEAYEVSYALRSVGQGTKLVSWRVRVDATAEVPSLASVFAGADWQEREQFDLVGVLFSGHPDLRRVMMPESWAGHPLRRDYPAATAVAPWR